LDARIKSAHDGWQWIASSPAILAMAIIRQLTGEATCAFSSGYLVPDKEGD
jgi:hypothetical protein